MKKQREVYETLDYIKCFFRKLPLQLSWFQAEVVDKILDKEHINDIDAKELLTQKILGGCEEIERGLAGTEEVFRDGLFLWDWVFLKTLIKTGASGKEFAKKIVLKLESHAISYHESQHIDIAWNNNHLPMLLILGESIWLDSAKNLWIRKKKMFQRCQKEYGSLQSNRFSIEKLTPHYKVLH